MDSSLAINIEGKFLIVHSVEQKERQTVYYTKCGRVFIQLIPNSCLFELVSLSHPTNVCEGYCCQNRRLVKAALDSTKTK